LRTPTRVWTALGVAFLLPLFLAGCENDDPRLVRPPVDVAPGEMVSFSQTISPIFDLSCGSTEGCHTGAFPEGDMSLDADAIFSGGPLGAVGVPSTGATGLARIAPGIAESSYLTHKIQGTQASVGGDGGRMPDGCTDDLDNCDQSGFCLCAETIQVIREWIDQGAQDN
jgi:hypothetical protein